MQRKTVLLAISFLVVLLFVGSLYSPLSRVRLFQSFGWSEWVYQHLTTVDEKVAMINNHFNPGGQQMEMFTSTYSGFTPFYFGKEMIWCISDQPFLFKAVLEGESLEDGVPLERLDDDTLVFNSREFPITLTLTRTEPSPREAELGRNLVFFFIHASKSQP